MSGVTPLTCNGWGTTSSDLAALDRLPLNRRLCLLGKAFGKPCGSHAFPFGGRWFCRKMPALFGKDGWGRFSLTSRPLDLVDRVLAGLGGQLEHGFVAVEVQRRQPLAGDGIHQRLRPGGVRPLPLHRC